MSLRIAHAPIRELGPDELRLLPDVEREREFRSAGRRNQFRCARWLLRSLLRDGGEKAAAAQDILVGEHGKPYFANGPAFSMAHTDKRVACCVGGAGPVGVDLESSDTKRNIAGIAERFFSAEESQWLSTQPAERFFMLWVLKEAWVKARGLSIFGNMKEPGFRVEPPLLQTSGGGDVNNQALLELDGAFLAVASRDVLPTELGVEQWDTESQSFIADPSVQLVART